MGVCLLHKKSIMALAGITHLVCQPIGSEAKGNATFSEAVCAVAFLKMYRLAYVSIGRDSLLLPR
jgi:hypothetical protein